MRPAGEVHLALLQAAHAILIERAQSGQGATLRELVTRSQVGYAVARAMVPKLTNRGQLQKVGERRVAYRNRPVAEYAPAPISTNPPAPDMVQHGWVDLGLCMADWVR